MMPNIQLSAGLSLDSAALLRALAAATDWDSLCALLERAIPAALPATRFDIYAKNAPGRLHLRFSTDPLGAAAPIDDSEVQLRYYLQRQGYGAIMLVPLAAFGSGIGWLALARRQGSLAPPAQALAEQIAPIVALWLHGERCDADLAASRGRETALEQLVRSTDKLRQRATLAAGAAHDIGNLFTTVMGYAQILHQDLTDPYQDDVTMIIRAVEDGRQLLRRLQGGEPAAQDNATPIPAAQIVEEAVRLTRPLWERRDGVVVDTILDGPGAVSMPAQDLREVLVNLIMNALTAVSAGGAITITCHTRARNVEIAVLDNGQGIARELHSAIFQPFMTTRSEGSGLGLSVSRALVENYGGTLTVDSAPGRGATFMITLPIAPQA
jgi:signal transduction histidine kinase